MAVATRGRMLPPVSASAPSGLAPTRSTRNHVMVEESRSSVSPSYARRTRSSVLGGATPDPYMLADEASNRTAPESANTSQITLGICAPGSPARSSVKQALRSFVKMLAIAVLGDRLGCAALRAVREAADRQRRELERAQSDPVLRVRHRKAEDRRDEKVIQAGDRDDGTHGCYPKASVKGGDDHQKKIQEPGGGEIEIERECEPGARGHRGQGKRRRPAGQWAAWLRHHVNLRSSLYDA